MEREMLCMLCNQVMSVTIGSEVINEKDREICDPCWAVMLAQQDEAEAYYALLDTVCPRCELLYASVDEEQPHVCEG